MFHCYFLYHAWGLVWFRQWNHLTKGHKVFGLTCYGFDTTNTDGNCADVSLKISLFFRLESALELRPFTCQPSRLSSAYEKYNLNVSGLLSVICQWAVICLCSLCGSVNVIHLQLCRGLRVRPARKVWRLDAARSSRTYWRVFIWQTAPD